MAELFSVCRWTDQGDLLETVAIVDSRLLGLIASREARAEFPENRITVDVARDDRMDLTHPHLHYNVCRWDHTGTVIRRSLVTTSSRRVAQVIYRQAIADFPDRITLHLGASVLEERPAEPSAR